MKTIPIKAHDRVVLTADRPEHRLAAGDVGTVVHVYADRRACEVEFLTLTGETADVVTVATSELRPVRRHELIHAREARTA